MEPRAASVRRITHQNGHEVCDCAKHGHKPCLVNVIVGEQVFDEDGNHVSWRKDGDNFSSRFQKDLSLIKSTSIRQTQQPAPVDVAINHGCNRKRKFKENNSQSNGSGKRISLKTVSLKLTLVISVAETRQPSTMR